MTTLTKEQAEQKLQQLQQLTEEVNAVAKELAKAGVIKLSDEELDNATGGLYGYYYNPEVEDNIKKAIQILQKKKLELKNSQHSVIF